MKKDTYEVIIKNYDDNKINYTFLLQAEDYIDAFLKLSKQVDDTIQWADNNKMNERNK